MITDIAKETYEKFKNTPYKKALPYKSRRRYTTQYSKAEQYII